MRSLLVVGIAVLVCLCVQVDADNAVEDKGKLTLLSRHRRSAISVKVVDSDEKTYKISIDTNDKIKALRAKVAKASGVDVTKITLLFNNNQLQDGRKVSYYGIKNGNTIYMEVQ